MKNYRVRVNNKELEATLTAQGPDFVEFEVNKHSYRVEVAPIITMATASQGAQTTTVLTQPSQPTAVAAPGDVLAPIPGKVVKVVTEKGAKVKAGDTLIIVEAMKMENNIAAPNDGTVDEILVKNGEQVERAQKLISLSAD